MFQTFQFFLRLSAGQVKLEETGIIVIDNRFVHRRFMGLRYQQRTRIGAARADGAQRIEGVRRCCRDFGNDICVREQRHFDRVDAFIFRVSAVDGFGYLLSERCFIWPHRPICRATDVFFEQVLKSIPSEGFSDDNRNCCVLLVGFSAGVFRLLLGDVFYESFHLFDGCLDAQTVVVFVFLFGAFCIPAFAVQQFFLIFVRRLHATELADNFLTQH